MLLWVSSITLKAEAALPALARQRLLGLLAGQRRRSHLFTRLLSIRARPFVRGGHCQTSRSVLDRYLLPVAFVLPMYAWLFAARRKISLRLDGGMRLCR